MCDAGQHIVLTQQSGIGTDDRLRLSNRLRGTEGHLAEVHVRRAHASVPVCACTACAACGYQYNVLARTPFIHSLFQERACAEAAISLATWLLMNRHKAQIVFSLLFLHGGGLRCC